MSTSSNTTAPTQFLHAGDQTYAYRRFGSGPGLPLLFLQHFTGTLDNWDPAVTDPLASVERSSCSRARVSGGPQARCLTRSPAWRSMRLLSWTGLGSHP